MKIQDLIKKDIAIAEKWILQLIKSNDLKKLSEREKYQIADFYKEKSKNRLETAKLIFGLSSDSDKKKSNEISQDYSDYSEAVSSAYYAMYYVVHAYLADKYNTKLREGTRGVHSITKYIILYYLVKTKKLAQHLYQNYINTFETTTQIQKLNIEDFQEEAYKYAKKYDKSRTARETFTYKAILSAEAYHAEQAISTAEEFINAIRQLML